MVAYLTGAPWSISALISGAPQALDTHLSLELGRLGQVEFGSRDRVEPLPIDDRRTQCLDLEPGRRFGDLGRGGVEGARALHIGVGERATSSASPPYAADAKNRTAMTKPRMMDPRGCEVRSMGPFGEARCPT
jgi:hypothetical protein